MSEQLEARLAALERLVEHQRQAIASLQKRMERYDIAQHTAGKTVSPITFGREPPIPEAGEEARTFDEWSTAGYRIRAGERSTRLEDGRRVFYASQVWQPQAPAKPPVVEDFTREDFDSAVEAVGDLFDHGDKP